MAPFLRMVVILYAFSGVVIGQTNYGFKKIFAEIGNKLIYQQTNVCSKIQCALLCSSSISCDHSQYCAKGCVCALYELCVQCPANTISCSGDTQPITYVLYNRFPTAEKYLVTGPDGVSDNQLSESSYYPDGYNLNGKSARLNGTSPGGCWSSLSANNNDDYVQVDFQTVKLAACVVLAGRPLPASAQYVTSFRAIHSVDCVTFIPVRDENGNEQVFAGCSSAADVVTRCFQTPVSARCVRINPVTYYGWKSLRFDVLGY